MTMLPLLNALQLPLVVKARGSKRARFVGVPAVFVQSAELIVCAPMDTVQPARQPDKPKLIPPTLTEKW